MSRNVISLHHELPGHILQRRQWVHDMEMLHQDEADRSMSLVPWLVLLSLLVTSCLVVAFA